MSFVHAGLAPLRERPFRLLFFGRTLSGIGDAIVPVALTFAVLDLGDATDLGLVLGSSSAARVVFLLVGGVWADRLPRQLVMMASDVVRALVQALLALGSVLFGAAGAFFQPASTGLVPQLVSRERLQEANALLGLARSAIEVFGPVVSGIVVATLGFGIVFAVDAMSFVASLGCLAAMRLPRAIERGERRSVLAEAIDGLRVVRERRWITAGLVCDLVFNLAFAAYFVLGPVVYEQHFDGPRDWGLAMTAAGVGAIVGGLLVLRLRPARPLRAAYIFSFVTPAVLLALAVPLSLPVVVAGSLLISIAAVLVNTYWATMEQQHVPAAYLSRVDSLGWMISLVAFPIGSVLAGPLSDAIGVGATLVAAAALMTIGLAAALSVRDFRELRRLDDDTTTEIL